MLTEHVALVLIERGGRQFEAAHAADVDTDRVSFTAALRIARRSISQARDFPPSAP